jgi:chromosome segregation ATPase
MKKIDSFSIKKITMTGFKCFKDTVSFDFGDMTFITASNGQGKSSVADAIAFAFVGTPFFGDRGLDRLHNKNSDEMTVSVDFVDDTGEAHTLTRSRKNDATSIAYDGLTARQSDLTSAFGDKDVFLSILNPLYFINVLGDSGKSLLEKLLPVVTHDEVLAALSESSQAILADHTMLSPETFIKNNRAELKKLEETLIGYQSQKELLDCQREERAAKLNEMRTAVNDSEREISELIVIRDNNRNIASEESALSGLRKRRDKMLSDAVYSDADKAIQGVMEEIRATERIITKLETKAYTSAYAEQMAEAEANLKVLYAEHGRINAALSNAVVGYKCPVCAATVSTDNISAVRDDLQQRLSALVIAGKTSKNALAEIKSQDATAKGEFDKQKAVAVETENNKLAALNQRLQEMNVARELDSEDYGEQLAALDSQINEHASRLANGNWLPEQALRFAELGEIKKGYEAQAAALSSITDYDFTALIADTETEISQLKRLINEGILYMAKRIELMLGGMKMNNTEIVLTEIIKTTGEVKDCFRFSYDGRDYRCLSLSEKVRAGLDVATLIQRLSGRNYPIFIDNGESICTFGNVNLSGQVILARVVNNQALQVTHRSRERSKAAA